MRALCLKLWDGSKVPTTRATADADARKALEAWMQEGDYVRAYPITCGTRWYVCVEGEHTDAWAMLPDVGG
jgi:hypothetical protein